MDFCVCCGRYVPEGAMVCKLCIEACEEGWKCMEKQPEVGNVYFEKRVKKEENSQEVDFFVKEVKKFKISD